MRGMTRPSLLLALLAALAMPAAPAGAWGLAGGRGGFAGRPVLLGRVAPGVRGRLVQGGGFLGRGGLYRRALLPRPLVTPGFRRSALAGAVGLSGYGLGGLGVPNDPTPYAGEAPPDGGVPLFAYPAATPACAPRPPPSAPGLPTVYYPASTVFCGP